MEIKKLLLLFSLLVFVLASCGEEEYPEHPWEWGGDEEAVEKNPNIVQQGWTPITNLGELPKYLQVYKSPETLEGNKAVAYIAVADMKAAKFELLGEVDYSEKAGAHVGSKLYAPFSFYEQSKCPVVINAGLFFPNKKDGVMYYHSQNLFVQNGKLLSPNQNYYSKDWVTVWYPTLGAFCQLADGTFRAAWTYYTTDKKQYYYSKVASNDINKTPLQVPSATFPVPAEDLQVVNAIGGVSVLLHQGTICNTYVEEMLDVAATSNQPRTAIGSTADGKLILFVCEGRNKVEGIYGLSTAKVAEVMKNLGCVEALNLDGGGSSCMLVNGHETIKCSDGQQREVLTAIGLR